MIKKHCFETAAKRYLVGIAIPLIQPSLVIVGRFPGYQILSNDKKLPKSLELAHIIISNLYPIIYGIKSVIVDTKSCSSVYLWIT